MREPKRFAVQQPCVQYGEPSRDRSRLRRDLSTLTPKEYKMVTTIMTPAEFDHSASCLES